MRRFCATHWLARNLLASASVAALLAAQTQASNAHTVSIGYAFVGPGAVNIWYGSYHGSATYTEADLQLVGPSFNSTVAFSMTSATKPTGLIDGTNNFFSNTAGTALVGTPQVVASTDGSGGNFNPPGQLIVNWQGVAFSGLRPGTYTFTYNPLGIPTVEWHPINDIIRTGTFTLTAADILGIPGYRFYGTNVNQRAVGSGLDAAIGAGGYNQAIYNIAALTPAAMASALTMMSGEVHTQSSRAVFQSGDVFMAALLDPFAGGVRGGDFGASSFAMSPYGGSAYGTGGSPYGNSPYDPQYPNGPGSPGGAQQYGDTQYNSASPQYYDPYAPNGSGPGSNSPYSARNGSAQGDRYRGHALQKQLMENRWGIWHTTYGGQSTASGSPVIGSHDTDIRIGGMIAGIDRRFASGGVIGAAVAAGVTSWGLSDNLGTGKSDAIQAGVYGSQRFGKAYLSGSAAVGWHQMSTDRTVTLSGNDQLRGTFSAQSMGGRLETGYRFSIREVGVTPHVAGQLLGFNAPAYSETVAGGSNNFALDIAQRNTTQVRSEAGIWVDKRVAAGPRAETFLRGRIAWIHEWMDAAMVSGSFQAMPGASFNVIGADSSPDRLLLSAGIEMRLPRGFSVSGKFDAELASAASHYVGMMTVRYQW